jgi:hypothetical protein
MFGRGVRTAVATRVNRDTAGISLFVKAQPVMAPWVLPVMRSSDSGV